MADSKHPVPAQDVDIIARDALRVVTETLEDRIFVAVEEAEITLPEMTDEAHEAFKADVMRRFQELLREES